MPIPNRPRTNMIMETVAEFFEEENISSFPVDPFQIIERNGWDLYSYSELARIHNRSIRDVIETWQTEDAVVIRDGEQYMIAYNDTVPYPGRIRFTLMHEIGHIKLNHLLEFKETSLNRGGLTTKQYDVLESEAHAFARNVLAPAYVVDRIRNEKIKYMINDLVQIFQISLQAARTRVQKLKSDSANALAYVDLYAQRFNTFVFKILNTNFCLRCSHTFVNTIAYYCPICGYNRISKETEEAKMIYTGHLMNDELYPYFCPRCENEQISGKHCKICGTHLQNKCTNFSVDYNTGYEWGCGAFQEGDARHCTSCGSITTYLRDGLLRPWEEDKEELEQRKKRLEPVKAKEEMDFHLKEVAATISDADLPF